MVVELPLRSQPRAGVLPLWTQPSGGPLPPAQVALAQLQVCVASRCGPGAGLGRADQGNDLSWAEQVRVKGSSLFHFPVFCPSLPCPLVMV